MKKLFLITNLVFISLLSFAADDNPEKAGDNLDLNAVLDLFEKSESVEDFENKLNSEKNDVNNLDLNEDGFVDYIRVIDYADGNTHSLTLQVPFNNEEAQDVAVILLEENGEETSVQIVGDEDLYGENAIVEPGDDNNDVVTNVHAWKPVRHIYSPAYVIWVSPWRYGRYPTFYKPWKPVPWVTYHGYPRNYPMHYRHVHVYRCKHAHQYYSKHRVQSHTFQNHPYHYKNVQHPPQSHPQKQGSNKKKAESKVMSPSPGSAGNASGASQNKSSQSNPTKRPGGTNKSQTPGNSRGNKGGKKRP